MMQKAPPLAITVMPPWIPLTSDTDVRCGHMTWIEIGTTGKSCHKCGYRIFVKPRREGPDGIKTLRAE